MSEYQSNAPQPSYGAARTGVITGNPGEIAGKSARSENSVSSASALAAATSPSPLRSAEAFEGYCAQVQVRLAEHAAQRISFLQSAYDRLTRLLHTARAVEDTALYNELWQHRIAVRELLEAASQVSAASVPPVPAVISNRVSSHPTSSHPISSHPGQGGAASALAAGTPAEPAPRTANGQATPAASAHVGPIPVQPGFAANQLIERSGGISNLSSPAYHTQPLPAKPIPLQNQSGANGHSLRDAEESSRALPTASGELKQGVPASGLRETPVEPTPRPVRHPVRPLTDIEADAAQLRASLRAWNRHFPLRDVELGQGNLKVPNCLRLRAVACRMRRLEEEAGDTEVAEVSELGRDIEDLLDEAGDEEYTVALDYEIEPAPTAYQWGELAERYEETARAEEAFEWWIAHRSLLSVSDVQALAESVAAIQQRFNRLLFRIGARDPFQQQLFDDLRIWAKEAQCYLYSLRPKVPIAELIEKAQTIDEAWEHAREPVRALEERQQAIEAIIAMVSVPDFGANEEEDERRLQEALLRCKELRIPASDRRLRDALLPWAAFLESDERFKELSREIELEWERKQESGRSEGSEEDPAGGLEELSAEIEAVRKVTQGKRCLMLGGTCREENRRKIEEALQLAELIWPSTKPSDPLSKFDTELRHVDIVALLTRFSRKEWKHSQDFCAREGKKFVHLTTGYGVAQVIRHFYNQIAPRS